MAETAIPEFDYYIRVHRALEEELPLARPDNEALIKSTIKMVEDRLYRASGSTRPASLINAPDRRIKAIIGIIRLPEGDPRLALLEGLFDEAEAE